MTPLDYDFLRQVLKERSGLALGADKHYFLESRLLPLARRAGLSGVGDLVLALKTGRDAALMAAVVEARAAPPDCDQWRSIERISASKNPGEGRGFENTARFQAGIFASSSDGSRST